MNKISQIFSTLFFIGYSKWAPGTIGSLASLIIIIFLQSLVSKTIFIVLFICIFILATIFVTIYSKTINNHDAREIVIDEFLGIYLILIFSYNFNSFNEFVKIFLIFIFFRLFDIIKLFPANFKPHYTAKEEVTKQALCFRARHVLCHFKA